MATWLEIAIRNGGLRKAIRAITWANTWATAREALGHDPSVEEVAEWWNASVRSTYREQAAFRVCYPTLDNPGPLYDSAEARARIRQTIDAFETLQDARAKAKAASADNAVLNIGLLASPPGTLG